MASNRFALPAALLAAATSASCAGAELFRYSGRADGGAPPVSSARRVEVDDSAWAALAPGRVFEARVPDGTQVQVRIDAVRRHSNGDVSWNGRVIEASGEHLAIGTLGASGAYGELQTARTVWGLSPAPGGAWIYDKRAAEASTSSGPHANDARRIPREAR